MLLYRGHVYQLVTAEVNSGLADAIADFLFGQAYDTETVAVPAGEFITTNEMTEEERRTAAALLSRPEVIKEKLNEYFGSLDTAKNEFAATVPELVEISTAEFENMIPSIADAVQRNLLDQYLSLAYDAKPW